MVSDLSEKIKAINEGKPEGQSVPIAKAPKTPKAHERTTLEMPPVLKRPVEDITPLLEASKEDRKEEIMYYISLITFAAVAICALAAAFYILRLIVGA